MTKEWRERLAEGLASLGLTLEREQAERFGRYLRYLLVENERVNLTAIVDPAEVAVKHFVDSAAVLTVLGGEGRSLVDVGSGAGFPGVPLAILRPDLQVTLVEANQKKAGFLERLRTELDAENVRVVKGRAEEIGRQAEHRERYSVAVARAVASLPVVWEYLLPLVEVGGLAVALKGPAVVVELESGAWAARVLGGGDQSVQRFRLNEGVGEREIVWTRKVAATPEAYPRRPGMPAKRPLQAREEKRGGGR